MPKIKHKHHRYIRLLSVVHDLKEPASGATQSLNTWRINTSNIA